MLNKAFSKYSIQEFVEKALEIVELSDNHGNFHSDSEEGDENKQIIKGILKTLEVLHDTITPEAKEKKSDASFTSSAESSDEEENITPTTKKEKRVGINSRKAAIQAAPTIPVSHARIPSNHAAAPPR